MALTKAERELLDQKFKGIHIKLEADEQVRSVILNQILAQVTVTNDRVGKSEGRIRELEDNWLMRADMCPHKQTITKLDHLKIGWSHTVALAVGVLGSAGMVLGILAYFDVIF